MKHENTYSILILICGLGFIILFVGFWLTTIPLPQLVIVEAEKYYVEVQREYGPHSFESRQAYQSLEAVRNARPYSAMGTIIALIGFVTIVLGVAIGYVSKQVSETHAGLVIRNR